MPALQRTDVFTSGQVAKILRMSPRLISKLFDKGTLTGYRLPDSKDRRIHRASVVAFLAAHGMPAEWINDSTAEAPPRGQAANAIVIDEVVTEKSHAA